MKLHAVLIMAVALGMAVAPVALGVGAVQAGTDARIVFYVA